MSEPDFHFTFHFSNFQYPLSQDTGWQWFLGCQYGVGGSGCVGDYVDANKEDDDDAKEEDGDDDVAAKEKEDVDDDANYEGDYKEECFQRDRAAAISARRLRR